MRLGVTTSPEVSFVSETERNLRRHQRGGRDPGRPSRTDTPRALGALLQMVLPGFLSPTRPIVAIGDRMVVGTRAPHQAGLFN